MIVKEHAEHIAEPHRDKAKTNRTKDISARVKPFSITRQIQRLKAKRRKGGIASADSDHHKLPHTRRHKQATVRIRECIEKSDYQRARDIYSERAPRKGADATFRNQSREPKSGYAAQRPADCHPKIAHIIDRIPNNQIGMADESLAAG